MITLGIESTAHTFSCGIIDSRGRKYANIISAYKTEHGGINPSEARSHHEKAKEGVVEEALNDANLRMDEIGLISFVMYHSYRMRHYMKITRHIQ